MEVYKSKRGDRRENRCRIPIASVLGSDIAVAQGAGGLKFEVASVRPAVRDENAPSSLRGGPGNLGFDLDGRKSAVGWAGDGSRG
jgi:hypothetical protein